MIDSRVLTVRAPRSLKTRIIAHPTVMPLQRLIRLAERLGNPRDRPQQIISDDLRRPPPRVELRMQVIPLRAARFEARYPIDVEVDVNGDGL
jgi:hypothetical protein